MRCRNFGRRVIVALATASALLGALGLRLRRSRASARDVPLSPLRGGWFVGPDYPERSGVATVEEPLGEVDDLSVFARPEFDPKAVHPAVRRFYERTSEYDLAYRTTWHRGFRLGAAFASHLTTRLGQLNLPAPDEANRVRRLRSRFVGVDPAADPRTDARAWVRTDPTTGEAVFVAVYATHEHDGETFTNIAVPLPGGNLSTVLRVEALDAANATGLRLTTFEGNHSGLYLVTPLGPFALPVDQEFRVWPSFDGTSDLQAVHEMWLFGRRFLTVDYAIRRTMEA